ncbi:MAG: hypothetical protein KTR30_16790, partial [Saprospiraceae bacterium]|nr:hypothetical protein [Saprospiraceae bacterium]
MRGIPTLLLVFFTNNGISTPRCWCFPPTDFHPSLPDVGVFHQRDFHPSLPDVGVSHQHLSPFLFPLHPQSILNQIQHL